MQYLRRGRRRRHSARRGVTAVEFSLVAPLIFLLFFGLIEFTRLNFLRHSVQNTAYEAARRVIPPGSAEADARETALNLLAAVGANRGAQIDVVQARDRVTVSIEVPYDQNAWTIGRFVRNVSVGSSCTLMRETLELTSN